jgi:serum/glucocorticoid-regulated kinase 2
MDVNSLTKDGWLPLQLAIHKNHVEIFKLLMKDSSIRVNELSEKGLALNLACKRGRIQMIQMLIQ